MSPQTNRAFVFFDANLGLLSSPDAIGDSPARALAFHLLCSAIPRLSTRSMLVAMASAPRRLQRAMYLVRQVEVDEKGSGLASAIESWATLAHDLGWAARSQRVGHYLVQLAEAVGIVDTAAAADEVQRALGQEIVPVMHARLYVASFSMNGEPVGAPSKRDIHARYLSTWSGPAPTSAAFVDIYTAYLGHLAMTSSPPTRAMVDVVLTVIASRGSDSIEARMLVTTFAQVVASALKGGNVGKKVRTLTMLMDWLSALDDAGPPCAESLDLLARLYFLRGLEHRRAGDYSASAQDLAQAYARDPRNTHVHEALDGLVEAVKKEQQRIMSSVYSREQIPGALNQANRLGNELHEALSGVEEDAPILLLRRLHGHKCDVAWRLGLDVTNPVHLEKVDTLLSVLASAAPDRGCDYASWVKHTALEQDPEMAELPWERLWDALLHAPVVSPFELSARLEPPTAHLNIPVPAELTANPGVQASQPTKWWQASLLWALTWRNPILKLAAAMGLMLLVYGTATEIRTTICESRKRSAYAAVLETIERGDDPVALSAAANFLERVVPDLNDPRARQVHNLFEQILLRHTLQLTQRGQLDEAGAVLARYAALALESSDDETTRAMDKRATEEHLQ